jgi:MerR family transcriptional regulator/heat shock protein HspR
MISAVAERFDIHPQTLRLYEREGLLQPTRSAGNTRLYDEESIQRLETILFLTRELGVNLAGVEVILSLREQMEQMKEEMDQLLRTAREQLRDRRSGLDRQHALVRVERRALVKVK